MFGHDNQDNQNDDNQHQFNGHVGDGGDSTNQATVDLPAPDDNQTDNGGFVAAPAEPASVPAATDDLLDIKQEALQALTPLVGQLEQTPEEQFRTTMMMIQASDNHSLVRVAYDAAKKISNEKERAQALLDIVNEINYFTQHPQA